MDKTHAIIEIDSSLRTSGSIENFEVILNHPVYLNRDRQYFVRLENIKIPTSFYNINTTNNVLKITEDPAGTPDPISVTVPPGNYTESELRTTTIALLNTATLNANTYSMTFDSITGKITITTDTTEFFVDSITNGSVLNPAFGFNDAQNTSTSLSLVSINHISLDFLRYLNIKSDLGSNNHYSKTNLENIGVQVPITEGRSTIQFYDNHNGYKAKMETKHSIKNIRFRIIDSDRNQVDLNGVDWSCEVVIYEWRG